MIEIIVAMKRGRVILFVIFFACLFGYNASNEYRMKKCHRIIIAKQERISGGYKNQFAMHYSFSYDSVVFFSSGSLNSDLYSEKDHYKLKGKRFFLKILCSDPKNSRIIWDVKVPDTLSYVPEKGWEKLPYGLDSLSK